MEQLFKTYDHWNFERLRRHILYWGGWGAFYVVVNFLAKGSHPLWVWASFELLVVPIKIACAYTIAYYLMPKYLYNKQWATFFWTGLGAIIFYGVLLYCMYYFVVIPHLLHYEYKYQSFVDFFYKAVELVHITSLVVGIKFFQNLLQQEQVHHQLKEEKANAELKYLRNQIQPHFLFNTLNNLYGMVLSNDKEAPNVIIKLSEMLGYSIYDSESSLVSLEEEVDFLDNYIALERLRYGDKLELNYQKSAVPPDLLIAPLLLVPFVENAFKHGPAKQDEHSRIDLNLEVIDRHLNFRISNTFEEVPNAEGIKSGIGLANVRKRLQLLYPNRHHLNISEGELFEVDLKIELELP